MPKKPNPTVAEDYQPYGDYLILQPEQEAEVSEGGVIIIPEQARKFLNEGKVLKVGPDVGSGIKPGMFVTFEAASEYRLNLGLGVVTFVIKENAVILTREDKVGKLFPAQKEDIPAACEHGVSIYKACSACARQ